MVTTPKEQYERIRTQYSLPSFTELNGDFELDKIEHESEFILRTVRKCMLEKIINALNFFDMLLNPSQAPRMYLPFVRTMTIQDKTDLEQLYGAFGQVSVDCLSLELGYDESQEAKMITRIVQCWNLQKPTFLRLVKHIGAPAPVQQKQKSYAG